MNSKLLYLSIGLLIGAVAGFFGANSLNRSALSSHSPATPMNGSVPAEITAGSVDGILEKAVNEPQNFAAQMQTGDLYAQIGRFDKAVEFYKRGLILQPENFEANVVLANALFDSQRFEEAEPYYAKALTLKEDDVNARIDLGATFVERASPDYDRAIKEFNKARELDPKSTGAVYYLGIAHLRKGDRETAIRMVSELEKLDAASPLVGKLRQNIDPPK